MKLKCLLFLLYSWSVVVGAQHHGLLRIKVWERYPLGTIHAPGDFVTIRWQLIDSSGSEVPSTFCRKHFEYFFLTITQRVNNTEITFALHKLPITLRKYRWRVPWTTVSRKYWFNLDAVPRDAVGRRAGVRFHIRTSARTQPMLSADNAADCLQILREWSKRQGYYKHLHPWGSLQLARDACHWLRSHLKPAQYRNYVKLIAKIESMRAQVLTVYCPLHLASLQVDHWRVGWFEQWSARRKMYFLQIPLPLTRNHAYRLVVRRDKKIHIAYHIHTAKSFYPVKEFHDLVEVSIISDNLPSRVALKGTPLPEGWGTEHTLQLYAGKSQIVIVMIQGGPALKIILNANENLTYRLCKRYDTYLLRRGRHEHIFVDNEVNLLQFK